MDSVKKTILIFGAGLNQVELIKAARELGVTSVVVDPMENPPGAALADFYYRVGGQDYARTKEIALHHHVDGIVTAQMEKPLRIMAKLAKELGFIFNSPSVIEQCRNKYLMKCAFEKGGIPCAKGLLFSKDVKPALSELSKNGLTFPLIIKPVDAFSSRGVYKVNDIDELLMHIDETSSFATNGEYLIEEFIEGNEYSVEAITFKGNTHIIQITEKFTTPYPRTVELGHLQPARITDLQKNIIQVALVNAIKALGIDNTATHMELKINNDVVKIIEIGARLGGDFISSYLTKASTGVSMDKAAIQVALGYAPDVTPNKHAVSFIRYIELPERNTVKNVLPLDDINSMPEVVFAHMYVKPGDVIQPIEHSAQRPACFILTGNTWEQVKNTAVMVEHKLKRLIIREDNVN